MNSSQQYSKKEFSLSQYYNQLEKYESGVPRNKKESLKKDYSLSSISKDHSKTSGFTKSIKESLPSSKQRISLVQKYASKTSFDKPDKNKHEGIKNVGLPSENLKGFNYLPESLQVSQITYKQWNNESRLEEKQNIPFSSTDEQKFSEHCQQLYNIKPKNNLVNSLAQQISKRDEVYQVVSNNFGEEDQENYCSKLEEHFSQQQLMVKIIEEFKKISKLEISDLNELYYFLKSDR